MFETVLRNASLNVICQFEGDFGSNRLEPVFFKRQQICHLTYTKQEVLRGWLAVTAKTHL